MGYCGGISADARTENARDLGDTPTGRRGVERGGRGARGGVRPRTLAFRPAIGIPAAIRACRSSRSPCGWRLDLRRCLLANEPAAAPHADFGLGLCGSTRKLRAPSPHAFGPSSDQGRTTAQTPNRSARLSAGPRHRALGKSLKTNSSADINKQKFTLFAGQSHPGDSGPCWFTPKPMLVRISFPAT